MNRMHRYLFVLVLILASCGGTSNGSVTDTQVKATCDRAFRCDLGYDAAIREVLQSNAQCKDILGAIIGSDNGIAAYLADHTVRLNQSALSACQGLIRANPCVSSDEFGICNQVYQGTVADGGGCVSDVQCASRACTSVGGQCGSCAASVAVGATCDFNLQNCLQQPEGRVRCEASLSGNTCVFHADAYLSVGVGSQCGDVNGVQQYCDADLYCDAANRCAARLAVGATCDDTLDQCAYGTLCGDNGLDFRCITVVPVTTIGDECGYRANGAFGVCDLGRGLFCDPNSTNTSGNTTCVPLSGSGVENSQCYSDGDCNSGLACVGIDFEYSTPGTCETTHKINGSACDASIECESQNCDYAAGAISQTCRPRVTCP